MKSYIERSKHPLIPSKKPVKEKSVMGKNPQPGPSGLQALIVEEDEMALSFLPLLCFPTNPKPATHPPSIQAHPSA
jgi:hypothetical protein